MPLTPVQKEIARLLAKNRSEDSYLAGGAAILALPQTHRYSQDLDFFQDSAPRVASAFEADQRLLLESGFTVETEFKQEGFARAIVGKKGKSTKIEWSRDSAFRFMPAVKSRDFGYQLHPVDLATNKVLALAGRDAARDVLDTLHFHQTLLPLGPLLWATSGKDPGLSPVLLLDLLRRKGRVRQEDLDLLQLTRPLSPLELKPKWLEMLDSAESFIKNQPDKEEPGCLYYSQKLKTFVDPSRPGQGKVLPHFGRPGGVLPRFAD